jgi:hypothetical protein
MQTAPNQDQRGDQPAPEPPPTVRSDSPKSSEIQNDAKNDEAQPHPEPPALVKESAVLRIYRRCKQRVWDSWHFDDRPSFFDALTAGVALIGLFFLINQSKQTNAALREASEANRLTKLAQERERLNGIEQDKRDARLITGFEQTARAAADSAAAARASAASGQRQADAAVTGNEQARTAFIAEQRARLSWEVAQWNDPADDGAFVIMAKLNNTGPTTASRVRYRTRTGASQAVPTLADALGPEMQARPWTDLGEVFPNEVGRTPRTAGQLTPAALKAFRAKTARHWFLIELQYCDQFQQQHWIRRCAHRTFGEQLVAYCGIASDQERDPAQDNYCQQ